MKEFDRLGDHGYWDLPVNDMAVLKSHLVSDFGGIRALNDPGFARWCQLAGRQDQVVVPTLHTAGWYDAFVQGTLDNHQAMAAIGRESRLVVGPWAHQVFRDPVGQQVFGLQAARNGAGVDGLGDWAAMQLAWFRRHLVPEPDVELPGAPVRIFVMGRNQWRDEASWPPARAEVRRWFLRGDGSLTTTSPTSDEEVSEFVYDPASPVPTVGGHGILWPGYPSGPMDQAHVEARHDVLVFTSEPLQRDLEVTGRVRVILHAESSATATDWVARLCDVHPDGRSLNLCDGVLRVNEGARQLARYEIDLWSTSNVFLSGHRLRVHVTSSSFPRWDRNLNTGDQRQSRFETAQQRISHAAGRPSYIELPVITTEV
jgi:hypothetical protein